MTPWEKRRAAKLGDSVSHCLREWLHQFRSVHGEPYVIALEVEKACLAMRARANTEAHYRSAIRGIEEPSEHAARRWSAEHWLETREGPDFAWLSGVMQISAWYPSFESFTAIVLESMRLGMLDAAAKGVLGSRRRRAAVPVPELHRSRALDRSAA